MSTGLLDSTGGVSCYPASMVNLIRFVDEKVFIVSALSNMVAEVESETQSSRKLCALVQRLA